MNEKNKLLMLCGVVVAVALVAVLIVMLVGGNEQGNGYNTMPTTEAVTAGGETTAPEQTTAPEETTAPVEETTAPTQATTAPTQETTAPTGPTTGSNSNNSTEPTTGGNNNNNSTEPTTGTGTSKPGGGIDIGNIGGGTGNNTDSGSGSGNNKPATFEEGDIVIPLLSAPGQIDGNALSATRM